MSICCCRFRRNTRSAKSRGTSRARARSIWRGSMGAQAWVHRAALLGAWIFRLDRRSGRKSDPRLYQEPGEGGSANGSIESDGADRLPIDSPINRGRVSVPSAALSGSQLESPRLCRGMVTTLNASFARSTLGRFEYADGGRTHDEPCDRPRFPV